MNPEARGNLDDFRALLSPANRVLILDVSASAVDTEYSAIEDALVTALLAAETAAATMMAAAAAPAAASASAPKESEARRKERERWVREHPDQELPPYLRPDNELPSRPGGERPDNELPGRPEPKPKK